jgi:hypothetical protein
MGISHSAPAQLIGNRFLWKSVGARLHDTANSVARFPLISGSKPARFGRTSRTLDRVDLCTAGVLQFRPQSVFIDLEKVLQTQGYIDVKGVRAAVQNVAERVLELAHSVMTPIIYYRRVAVTEQRAYELLLETGHSFENTAVAKYLSGATAIVAFIVSMGSALDHAEKQLLTDGKLLEAVFLEASAWHGIEVASTAFTQSLAATAAQSGFHVTRRMSPGYTYLVLDQKVTWPLDQQRALFKLFADSDIEVELLPVCGLIPKMSRSSICGLVPQAASSLHAGNSL